MRKQLIELFRFKESKRDWKLATLAAACVGLPLLIGLYFNQLSAALTSSLSALVILYLPSSGSTTSRINTLLVCSFGFVVAYGIGLVFSFSTVVAVLVFGISSFIFHWINLYYKTKAPRSFFFIMVMSISICQTFDLGSVPFKIGLISLGTIVSTALGLAYILFVREEKQTDNDEEVQAESNLSADIWEAVILGIFMSLSLGLGFLLDMDKPYWIPISTLAVMQGASLSNIWLRTFQRVVGTLLGVMVCWLLLSSTSSKAALCLYIIVLQFIVEMLISRNYAIAVVFITPLAIFMSEAAHPIMQNPQILIMLRFNEILLGSIIGAFGGWMLYKEKLRYFALHQFAAIQKKDSKPKR